MVLDLQLTTLDLEFRVFGSRAVVPSVTKYFILRRVKNCYGSLPELHLPSIYETLNTLNFGPFTPF